MIIINLATIDFGGGGGSSKPLITEPLIANIWSRGRRVFTPANYNVDGFSDVTINTAIIGDNSALDFSLIGWDGEYSDNVNSKYNEDITYSKEVLDKWNNGQISTFNGDKKLVYCPKIDTSNVTNMINMFNGCSSLTTIPLIDTSNVTNMYNMFYTCTSLESLPLLDTSNVTNMNTMFYECSSLTSIPLIDTSNVTGMRSMFYACTSLESLPLLDTSNVTDMGLFFGFPTITTLTDLGGFKNLKIDWNNDYGLVKCPNLTYQSVMNVLNNLYDFRANGDDTTTRTIKLHSNSYNLLSADDIAMANGMGWNITT